MTVVVRDTKAEVARTVADLIENLLTHTQSARLGVATGGTFEPIYKEAASRENARHLFAHTTLFLLDEYVGLRHDDPASYHSFIRTKFADRVELSTRRMHGPDGTAGNLGDEADRYERGVLAQPIDIQLLGLGRNAHIGFNEPGSSLASRTRTVRLSHSTRTANARYFPSFEQTPTHAITQGVGTIMNAGSIILVATGAHKAAAAVAALEGPITTAVPASVLQLHPDVTCVLDQPAASRLTFSVETSPDAAAH